ncbi:hypothetical protein BLS_004528 [Venturia inaequalis]|uniref:Uncharacterized protein n=1 Tax=Venturia inaequalis TaxID=5025 RepID=A0A8H3VPA1_VENIN|nr:hypothetical protein BLS_004528 [Venturia inaequalis]KAE9994022.1 hypothetical protein EG327_001755 [Venturia inaequalis]
MALRAFLLSSLAAATLALPSYSSSYHSAVEHQNQYGRRDGPGGHGGDSMAGASHGAGEKKPGGMGDSISDKIVQSPYMQPMYNAMSGMFPTMGYVQRNLDQPSLFKQAGAKKATILFGPYDLVTAGERAQKPNPSVMAMDPGATSFLNKVDFPKDITLLDAVVSLVYEDGSPANVSNGVYNHHIAFQDSAKKPTAMVACPGQAPKSSIPLSVFVGVGEDGNSFNYAPNLPDFDGGYYIGPDHSISTVSELINSTNEKKRVFAKVEFNYVQGKRKYDVSSVITSVTQCDGASSAIRPPPGVKVFSVKSKDLTIASDGVIFAVRGHLHDGGDYVGLSINGQELCQSKGIYKGGKPDAFNQTSRPTLSDMSTCQDQIPVKKGDIMTIIAKYDLENHPVREQTGGGEAEEMGLAMFSFAALTPTEPEPQGGGKWSSLYGMLQGGVKALAPAPAKTPATAPVTPSA